MNYKSFREYENRKNIVLASCGSHLDVWRAFGLLDCKIFKFVILKNPCKHTPSKDKNQNRSVTINK